MYHILIHNALLHVLDAWERNSGTGRDWVLLNLVFNKGSVKHIKKNCRKTEKKNANREKESQKKNRNR